MKNFIMKILFEKRLLTSEGGEFEILCSKLLKFKYGSEFTAIKPYGNLGDRKNDGYLPRQGIFFQIYGPEEIEKEATTQYACRKLLSDFLILKKHIEDEKWPEMREFNYIINDKGRAIPLKLAEYRDNLAKNENLPINILVNDDLKKIFYSLNEDEKSDLIICYVPDDVKEEIINFEALRRVTDYLKNRDPLSPPFQEKLIVPNFDEKIKFNNIPEKYGNLLKSYEYQLGYLLDYFNVKGENEVLILRDKFSSLYNEAILSYPNDAEKQFIYIYNGAYPNITNSIGGCILTLMSYFFSNCDIFKEPEK